MKKFLVALALVLTVAGCAKTAVDRHLLERP